MKLIFPLICGTLLALANPAWADVSRDDAAALAQRASGGRVLSVDTVQSAGRPAWRVKVVTAHGEVRVILIDVVSGRTPEARRDTQWDAAVAVRCTADSTPHDTRQLQQKPC